MKTNYLYNENCLDTMAKMKDNFIDLTVTSPPYDNLRTYKGFDFDWKAIIKELYRVTKQGGIVVWVVGDATIKGSESGTSFKQALHAIDCGFRLHDTMIYEKYGMKFPESVRYHQKFEYMFIFSKGKPNNFNPLKQKLTDKAISNKKSALKNGKKTIKQRIGDDIKETKQYFTDSEYMNKYNIWKYATGCGNSSSSKKKSIYHKHPAVFPEQLANDHIISWSNEGDLVYDCFMGSGTTAKMAIINKRKWIGSEMSLEYCDIIHERLKQFDNDIFLNANE